MLKLSDKREAGLIRALPLLILIYLVLQPILDVIGYWQAQLQLPNTLTLAVRMLLLGGSVGLGFLLSERKKYYCLTFVLLAVLTGLHAAANLPSGYRNPGMDLLNLLRIYLMPLTVLCFITFLRRGGEPAFRAMKTGLLVNFLVIAAVELASVLTGTDRKTYSALQIGVFGWFLWGNCQSAILSMLAPLVMCWSLTRWRDRLVPVVLLTGAAQALLYFFGTRLSFGAMILSGLGVAVCLLITDRSRWKQALAIFLVTAIFTGAYPLSPMVKRLQVSGENLTAKEKQFAEWAEVRRSTADSEEVPASSGSGEATETGEGSDSPEMDRDTLEWLYKNFFAGMIKRFGLNRVMERYNYTSDIEILGDSRLHKLRYCEMLMEDSPFLCHLFGLNLEELRVFMPNGIYNQKTGTWEDGYANFDVENDFHGIYFLLGWVGLGLTAVFLLYFGLRVLIRVLRDRKKYFTLDLVGFLGAYGLGLVHAYFTISVLRRNNASVYLAVVLAGLWYLTQKDPGRGETVLLHPESPQEPGRDLCDPADLPN